MKSAPIRRKMQRMQTQCIRVDKRQQKRADRPLQSRLLQTIRSTASATLARPQGTYGKNTPTVINKSLEHVMTEVVYVSKSRIERKGGPLRIAHLPGEPQPVVYSVHGAIAEHYKVDPAKLKESHASTIDYVISATAG